MNQHQFAPHVTVACVVEDNGRFLMVEELIEGDTRFNQPAGHLEAGESLIHAAERETLEETAWEVQVTHFLGVCVFEAQNGHTYIRNTFAAKARNHTNGALDTGIVQCHWYTREEIEQRQALLRSPMILSTIDQYLAGEKWPLAMVSHHR
ncbi:NUDIX hydrolase [Halioxenophilus aromaticivorans]|uniref:Phosphatase NudJ n=1 Tax=Halioxenophilus aromaticivorans TaxID=1306992 RepID=A0AAV3UAX9_9ALTE